MIQHICENSKAVEHLSSVKAQFWGVSALGHRPLPLDSSAWLLSGKRSGLVFQGQLGKPSLQSLMERESALPEPEGS